jgi:hypothetical protein
MSQCKYCGEEVKSCCGANGQTDIGKMFARTIEDYVAGNVMNRAAIYGILEGQKLQWGTEGMNIHVMNMLINGIGDMLASQFDPKIAKEMAKKIGEGIRRKTRDKIREMEEKAFGD